jgi:hypothetical protein
MEGLLSNVKVSGWFLAGMDPQELRLDSIAIKLRMRPTRAPASLSLLARTRMAELPHRQWLPVIEGIHVFGDGHLWVKRFSMPTDTTAWWYIFGEDGVFVGTVEMDRSLQPLDATERRLLVRARDEFDVETVRLYSLVASKSTT